MSQPVTIVFDLGKVLLDFDYSIAAKKVAARAKIKDDPMRFFTSQSELLLRYETGLVTSQRFFSEVCAATGYCGTFEEFSACFGDIFSEIMPMTQLQAELRRKGYATFIFSNTNEMAISHIRASFPFFKNFDGYVYSYEHRAMKPDPALYEVVEQATGRRGHDLVYIDDRPENVETGAARGWRTICHESPQQTIPTLRAMLPGLDGA